jgi:hypothetical protein
LDKFRSILSLLLVLSALTIAFHASSFLSNHGIEISVLAFSMDKSFPFSYDDGDDGSSKQMELLTYDQGTDQIIPISSSVSYYYTSSRGISVQQDVTQLNICSSNTAYCYNDVDNDFNVNPP